jgi:hypothetical protein
MNALAKLKDVLSKPNPDADMRLNIKMRGPHVIYDEEPIIEERDTE